MIYTHVLNRAGGRAVRSPLDGIQTLRAKSDAETEPGADEDAASGIGSELSEAVANDILWEYEAEE